MARQDLYPTPRTAVALTRPPAVLNGISMVGAIVAAPCAAYFGMVDAGGHGFGAAGAVPGDSLWAFALRCRCCSPRF